MYAEGRRHWADFELSFEAFEAHCASVLGETAEALALEHAAELYLCCACSLHDASAMRVVVRDGAETVRKAIARIRSDPDFVAEACQEVWAKLLASHEPRIAEYAGRGPLNSWLRVTAVRAALDAVRNRKVQAKRSQELDSAFAADALSPESRMIRERYAEQFQGALRRALVALPVRDRQLLRMQLQGRCTIDDIARVYGCHRATAARWLERARDTVFELLRTELAREQKGLSPDELRSIARVLGSALVLSIPGSAAALDGDRA